MSTRFQLSIIIFMMAQGVAFGIGVIAVLTTPLAQYADIGLPVVTALSFLLAAPASWKIAPKLRAAHQRRRVRLAHT